MYIWLHLHSNQNWECLTFVLKSFKKLKARFKIQSKKLFMKIKALENHVISHGIIIKYKAVYFVLNYCNHLGRIICFKINLQIPFSFLIRDPFKLPLLQQIWFFPPHDSCLRCILGATWVNFLSQRIDLVPNEQA